MSPITGLAYEGISSYLHNKWQKAIHQTFVIMERKVDLQHNKIVHLENSMAMYSIYNSETLEKLIKTLHKMHTTTTWNEDYLLENLLSGIIGINLKTYWQLCHKFSLKFENSERKIYSYVWGIH